MVRCIEAVRRSLELNVGHKPIQACPEPKAGDADKEIRSKSEADKEMLIRRCKMWVMLASRCGKADADQQMRSKSEADKKMLMRRFTATPMKMLRDTYKIIILS